jgi:phenylpropionate dioxygenase-like ring-hydroxylating dioxygenase large terminal subunit
MPFLRNAWYVAAWSNEVTRAPFHHTILNEPVLMYRREAGDAHPGPNRKPRPRLSC